jgi:PTS system fructose-specific IIB component
MKIVAVTACPTGIAHSQMGAENLETVGEQLGHDIKVEVQGSMGAENELTADDIAEADVVIIAADTSVSQDRFEGKPLVKAPVKDAVNDAEGLIEQAQQKVGAEGGSAEADAEADTDAAAAPGDGTETESDAEPEPAESTAEPGASTAEPAGSDRQKGLLARIKELFS